MSISFGLRQGTHPSLLPDLAAPSRWARPTRVTHSPIPGLSDDEEVTAPKISVSSEVTIGMATGSDAPRGPPSKKSKKGKKKKSEKAVSETEVAPATVTFTSRSLRLKVPPLKATDPDEPKYCYCNNISFGDVRVHSSMHLAHSDLTFSQMVACDYPHCKLEWVGKTLETFPHAVLTSTLTVPPRLRRVDRSTSISNMVLSGLRAACTQD